LSEEYHFYQNVLLAGIASDFKFEYLKKGGQKDE